MRYEGPEIKIPASDKWAVNMDVVASLAKDSKNLAVRHQVLSIKCWDEYGTWHWPYARVSLTCYKKPSWLVKVAVKMVFGLEFKANK